jgi:hypothetical protein
MRTELGPNGSNRKAEVINPFVPITQLPKNWVTMKPVWFRYDSECSQEYLEDIISASWISRSSNQPSGNEADNETNKNQTNSTQNNENQTSGTHVLVTLLATFLGVAATRVGRT